MNFLAKLGLVGFVFLSGMIALVILANWEYLSLEWRLKLLYLQRTGTGIVAISRSSPCFRQLSPKGKHIFIDRVVAFTIRNLWAEGFESNRTDAGACFSCCCATDLWTRKRNLRPVVNTLLLQEAVILFLLRRESMMMYRAYASLQDMQGRNKAGFVFRRGVFGIEALGSNYYPKQ